MIHMNQLTAIAPVPEMSGNAGETFAQDDTETEQKAKSDLVVSSTFRSQARLADIQDEVQSMSNVEDSKESTSLEVKDTQTTEQVDITPESSVNKIIAAPPTPNQCCDQDIRTPACPADSQCTMSSWTQRRPA